MPNTGLHTIRDYKKRILTVNYIANKLYHLRSFVKSKQKLLLYYSK